MTQILCICCAVKQELCSLYKVMIFSTPFHLVIKYDQKYTTVMWKLSKVQLFSTPSVMNASVSYTFFHFVYSNIFHYT